MKKIFTLKRWLTLADAAGRLTESTNSIVTRNDILQLCLEGAIPLVWQLGGKAAIQLTSYTELINWYGGTLDDPTHQLPYFQMWAAYLSEEFKPAPPSFCTYDRSPRPAEEVEHLNGAYIVCLDPFRDSAMREWLMHLITGSEEHTLLQNLVGAVTVQNEQGQKWSILKKRSNRDHTGDVNRVIRPPHLRRIDINDFYPTDEFPPIQSLVVFASDLARLETTLEGAITGAYDEVQLRGAQRNHYLKVIAGLLSLARINPLESVTEILKMLEGKGGQIRIDRATLALTLKDASKFRPQTDKPTRTPTP